MIRLLWAFLLRDFRHESSYKLAFLFHIVGSLPILGLFLLLSRLFGDVAPKELLPYGGRYFPFVLVGLAFQHYLYQAMSSFSSKIRESQLNGTLEILLAAPLPLPLFLAGSVFYSFLVNTFHVLIYLLLGWLTGSLILQGFQLPIIVLTMGLAALAYASLGILSASYILVFKKGDPITWLVSISSWLLGGVYFPTKILPDWLHPFSCLVPTTHVVESMRRLLLTSSNMAHVLEPLGWLCLWILLILPLSVGTFFLAVQRGRHHGTLGQY